MKCLIITLLWLPFLNYGADWAHQSALESGANLPKFLSDRTLSSTPVVVRAEHQDVSDRAMTEQEREDSRERLGASFRYHATGIMQRAEELRKHRLTQSTQLTRTINHSRHAHQLHMNDYFRAARSSGAPKRPTL